MYSDIKIGEKFTLKVNGSNYEVYAVTGREKKYIPNSGEAVIHLKCTSRSFFSLGSNLLLSCPEVELHQFFEKPEITRV